MSLFGDSTNLGLSFIVRNTAPQGKQLKVFNTPVANGNTIDVMKIPGISEDDVKASVLKGDLGKKLQIKYLTLVSSTLNFGDGNSDPAYAGLLTSLGITTTPSQNNQTTWYVSPATGNDTNTGLSGSPIKTLKELGRRLSSSLIRSLVTVNVLDNITDATDNLQIFANPQTQGSLPPDNASNFGSLNIALLIQGQRVTSTFTDPNTSSTTQLTMTSAAVAPSTTTGTSGPSGPSGLPAIITVSGFDFTSYIGSLIQITSSTPTASLNSIGVIVAAPSVGTAYISPLVIPLASGAQAVPITSANYPLNGSTFIIYTTTSWAPSFIVGNMGGLSNMAVMYQDIMFPAATRQTAHGQHYFFNGCIWNRIPGFSNGGEAGPLCVFTGCSFNIAAPPSGRTPTQITFTSGDTRFQSCGFLNIDVRCREGDGRVIFINCVMYNSQFVSAGPNDLNRSGPVFSLVLGAGVGDFGLGMFNWPAVDTLAPSPATVRGASGAAVHLGHGAKVTCNSKLYGYSSNSGTYGVKVQEGAQFYLTDRLTYQASPSNLGGVNPAYLAASLRITGLVSDFLIDGYLSPLTDSYAGTLVPFSVIRGVLDGTVTATTANNYVCTTWLAWESAPFLRNAFSLKTGAGILSILS